MAHLTRVKTRLALHPHHLVRGLLEGAYAAVQTGRGHEFNDLRDYVRGDDVKDIDWKASARGDQLLIKRYVAERHHRLLLCVSTGRSMAALDAGGQSKRDLAVLVAGVLGFLAVSHGDQVSLVHGDADERHLQRSGSSELHLERLLGLLHEAITPRAGASDLAGVLAHAARLVRRRAILVVISDDVTLSPEVDDLLRRLRAQHQVLHLTLTDLDPTRSTSGASGISGAAGASGLQLRDVDTVAEIPDWVRGDRELAAEYAGVVAGDRSRRTRRLDQLGIAHAEIGDQDGAIGAVLGLLERQRHARRR